MRVASTSHIARIGDGNIMMREDRSHQLRDFRFADTLLTTQHDRRSGFLFRLLYHLREPAEAPVKIFAEDVLLQMLLEQGPVAGFRLDGEALPQVVIARHLLLWFKDDAFICRRCSWC